MFSPHKVSSDACNQNNRHIFNPRVMVDKNFVAREMERLKQSNVKTKTHFVGKSWNLFFCTVAFDVVGYEKSSLYGTFTSKHIVF